MSFINTVDQLGDDVTLGKIIDGSITEFKDDVLKSVSKFAFDSRKNLTLVDLPNVERIHDNAFISCTALKTLILRSSTQCVVSNTNFLSETKISNKEGYIYVPSALIDSYKSASYWSIYANQFRVLEDYTVDGTTTGELDPTKI